MLNSSVPEIRNNPNSSHHCLKQLLLIIMNFERMETCVFAVCVTVPAVEQLRTFRKVLNELTWTHTLQESRVLTNRAITIRR